MMYTMPLEADTRLMIDNNLRNLGWILTGKGKNVYCERPRTQAEREQLGGKRPDYVLYSRQAGVPLIVIEAKRKGQRIDKALEQGISYAKSLSAPLVFATDGVFCKSYHTMGNKPPKLNGEDVDELLREGTALRFLTEYEVNTVSSKVQYDRRELIRIFDEANNMLRGDGLRAGIERFGEFANILFLKLISESERIRRESGIESLFDLSCDWDAIKNIQPSARIEYINSMVYRRLNSLYQTEIFTPLTIRDNSILKEIMDKLDPLTLTDVDSDVKGDAFEYFLKASTASKNDLGEYFTPRHIVKTMVRLTNPQIGEKVYDPFCGTGGFLIESFRHIYNNMPRNPATEAMLREDTIFGNEITNTARITKMNMILAGDGRSNIHMKDSLADPVDGKYDVVLANMPYSQKTKHGALYDLPGTNGDSICVQHCMRAISGLSENGRMALVVPEGFLFRRDLARTREYLLSRAQLQSVISLPQGVFLPYTGVKTNIIYASKINQKVPTADKRKNYWYFEVKSDGYSLDNHRRKLDTPSDLIKYEEYRKLDADQEREMLWEGFELIPLEKVHKNSLILSGGRYRERTVGSTIYESVPLKDICDIIAGQSPGSAYYNTAKEGLPFYQGNANFGEVCINPPEIWTTEITARARENDVLLSVRAPVGAVNICTEDVCIGRGLMAIRSGERVNYRYLFHILKALGDDLRRVSLGSTFEAVTKKDVEGFEIPLPPLDIQWRIADELERYQRIVDYARGIAKSYKPVFKIDPKWEIRRLGDVCAFEYGYTAVASGTGDARYIRITDIGGDGKLSDTDAKYITLGDENKKYLLRRNDLLVARIGATYGKTLLYESDERAIFASYLIRLGLDKKVLPKYYFYFSQSDYYWDQAGDLVTGGGQAQFNANAIKLVKIPIPPIKEQESIISRIEAEEALIEPAKELVEVFAKKIRDKTDEILGRQAPI